MSAVGPRPLSADDVRRLGWTSPEHDFRWGSRPGLTGLAQIAGAGTARAALELDRVYLERRSLLLDFQLIALTFAVNALGKARVRARLSRTKLVTDARSLHG
jgi:lipopolysaccharide/colanic/teichoic acid biosynthesis glycosyltransferase